MINQITQKSSLLLASAVLTLSAICLPALAQDTPAAAPSTNVAPPALNSPVGQWKTIDDESGKVKSIVEITEADGTLTGKVIKLFKKPEEDQNPKCDKCEGDLKDQPILGMKILWNLKSRGDDWGDGNIMDPNNGKTYNAKIQLKENGTKLKVRGFMGISLLGRSQVWERAN